MGWRRTLTILGVSISVFFVGDSRVNVATTGQGVRRLATTTGTVVDKEPLFFEVRSPRCLCSGKHVFVAKIFETTINGKDEKSYDNFGKRGSKTTNVLKSRERERTRRLIAEDIGAER